MKNCRELEYFGWKFCNIYTYTPTLTVCPLHFPSLLPCLSPLSPSFSLYYTYAYARPTLYTLPRIRTLTHALMYAYAYNRTYVTHVDVYTHEHNTLRCEEPHDSDPPPRGVTR